MQCLLLPRRSFATQATVVLRAYQEHCLHACAEALDSGLSRIGVSLPTGSGKTTVFISLLDRIKPPPNNITAKNALIVVNSIELARQSADQVLRLFPEWSVEIEQGVKHKASGNADVTVATYQTLLRGERLAKFDPKCFKAIIVDEAHHAAAPSYRRLLSHFDPSIKNPDEKSMSSSPMHKHKVPIIGFSATFSRHDGLALGSIFEHIVYHRDFLGMIEEQWLCKVRFTSVKAKIDLKNVTVNTRTGDFNPTSLAHVINTNAINELVVQTWLDRAAKRKSTLVFCVNVNHVQELTQMFRSFGVDARYIYAKTPIAERKALVTAFKEGIFPVLLNCAVLTEGADIPNIDCVVVARPTRSRNVFAQMIGRGMRLSPDTGKTDCRIIDFVDSSERISGVVSAPTLFGLNPDEIDIEDATIDDSDEIAGDKIMKISDESHLDIPEPSSVTYTDFDSPNAFVQASMATSHVSKLTQNSWVDCGEDKYVLECMGKGYITVRRHAQDTHYIGEYTPANLDRDTATGFKVSPFLNKRKINEGADLSQVIHGCDTYARERVVRGHLAAALLRTANWRKTPASESQKAFLLKKNIGAIAVTTDDGSIKRIADEKLNNMTKGEAANVITRLKNGAKKRFDKQMKADKKAYEKVLKEKKRRAREDVRVGPLSTR